MLLARLAGVNQASPEDYRRMDTLFHLSIAELTGSSLLAAACADARVRLNVDLEWQSGGRLAQP